MYMAKKNIIEKRVKEILEEVGGVRQVAYDFHITDNGIRQWYVRGIPMEHWDYFTERGIDLWNLYATHTPKWGLA